MYDQHFCLFFHSDWDSSKTWFLNTPMESSDFRQTNWSELTVLRCSSETGHHLLQSDFSTNNFRWICIGFNDPHGGLLAHTHSSMIRDELVNVFWGTASVFFQHFFISIDSERLSNCAGSNEIISVHSRHQYSLAQRLFFDDLHGPRFSHFQTFLWKCQFSPSNTWNMVGQKFT